MGKLGRFACIFTPMALSLASLICLLIIFLSGITGGLSNYYFMKADLTEFTANPSFDIAGTNVDNMILDAFRSGASNKSLDDVYQIYIWNYCSGPENGDLKCSGRKASFWFNPVEVWGLEDTAIQERFPDKLNDGLRVYRKVAGWMFAAYSVAFWVTVAEIVLGFFALFSRWGSAVTSIVSGVSTLFTVAAAITSSAMYGTVVGSFNSVLKPYKIEASMGTRALSVSWLAAAFSIGAGLFWLVSTCCCSGKSDRHRGGKKGTSVEKGPYTYERVESPFLGGGGARASHASDQYPLRPLGQQQSGYEPYRHQTRV